MIEQGGTKKVEVWDGQDTAAVINVGGTNALAVTPIGGSGVPITPIGSYTVIASGTTTVATAGVPVALAATQAVNMVCITPLKTNTSYVLTGASGNVNRVLAPFSSRTYLIDDPAKIFVDVAVSGEGVAYDLLSY